MCMLIAYLCPQRLSASNLSWGTQMTRTVSALLYSLQINIFTKVNIHTIRFEWVKVSITTSIDQTKFKPKPTFWKMVVSLLLRFLLLNSHSYTLEQSFLVQTIPVTLQCSVIMLHCHMLFFLSLQLFPRVLGLTVLGLRLKCTRVCRYNETMLQMSVLFWKAI